MKIGILIPDVYKQMQRKKGTQKKFFDLLPYVGLRRIVQDVHKKYTPEYCWISDIGKYDFVLCSLISYDDLENFVYTFEKHKPRRNGCKIIVGGAGCLNIKLISEYIDIACFGRGENQIVDILEGKDFDNVWRKEDDPEFKKQYQMRQFQEDVVCGGEEVGCQRKCFFCGYTWHRKQNQRHEKYGSYTMKYGTEADWNNLEIVNGKNYTSGIDGLSQKTRFLVNKKIRDQDIRDKINQIYAKRFKQRISIKLYMIVGYPWETEESTRQDFKDFVDLIKGLDRRKKEMQLWLFLNIFPFNSVPLTPFQSMPVNLFSNWKQVLGVSMRERIYNGRNIRIILNSNILSPFSLLKKMFCFRGVLSDLEIFKKMLFTNKLKALGGLRAVKYLYEKSLIPEYIYNGQREQSFSYLRTYADVYKLANKLRTDKRYQQKWAV